MWETFKRSQKPSPKDPVVTLSKLGMIGLNSAISRNIIGDARFALLLFDRERQMMGIKFIKQNEPDAYPVKLSANKGHGSIAGVAFMKAYGVFPNKTQPYPAKYDEHLKILTIDLTGASTVEEKESKRKGKAA